MLRFGDVKVPVCHGVTRRSFLQAGSAGSTHENGQRWMMTGHDFGADNVKPHSGSVISRVFGPKGELPANVALPVPIGNTGAGPLHGQQAGYLGSAHEPFFLNSDPSRPD